MFFVFSLLLVSAVSTFASVPVVLRFASAGGQQFIQSVGEGGDAIGQRSLCDFSQVDAQLGQAS
jgi:hypothetical protein